MPEPYYPKHKNAYRLSDVARNNDVIKVRCRYCKHARLFEVADLIEVFGDVDVDDVGVKMKGCRLCRSTFHTLDVDAVSRSAREARGVKWRKRVLVWKDVG
jgi:hypothetical protein